MDDNRKNMLMYNLIEMLYSNSLVAYESTEDEAFIEFVCDGNNGAGMTREEYDEIMKNN